MYCLDWTVQAWSLQNWTFTGVYHLRNVSYDLTNLQNRHVKWWFPLTYIYYLGHITSWYGIFIYKYKLIQTLTIQHPPLNWPSIYCWTSTFPSRPQSFSFTYKSSFDDLVNISTTCSWVWHCGAPLQQLPSWAHEESEFWHLCTSYGHEKQDSWDLKNS